MPSRARPIFSPAMPHLPTVAVLVVALCFGVSPTAYAQRPTASPTAEERPGMTDPRFGFDADLDYDPAVPHPDSFLGHRTGERFTVYADVVAYLRVLAQAYTHNAPPPSSSPPPKSAPA